MRGRKPKPHALKMVEGSHAKLIPCVEPTAILHEPPFNLPPYALQRFDELKTIATWLRDTESFALADYCLAEFRILQCEENIERRGLQVRTRRGPVANPYSRHVRHYRAQMNRLASELGLTPSSRERISDTSQQSAQSADEHMERLLCGDKWPFPNEVKRR